MLAGITRQRVGGYMRAEEAAELFGEVETIIDGYRAELDELDRLEDEGEIPAGQGWDDMTVPERLRAVQRAVVTPIRVLPGNGGPHAVPADLRVLITPR